MERVEKKMVWLQWENNNSPQYDGRLHDVEQRYIKEDRVQLKVGSVVHVNWGKQSRTWTAVVVSLLERSDHTVSPAPGTATPGSPTPVVAAGLPPHGTAAGSPLSRRRTRLTHTHTRTHTHAHIHLYFLYPPLPP